MRRALAIHGPTIRLGQLLKLAGVVESGSEARALLDRDGALVNGKLETRRGRQLRPGDVVHAGGQELEVVAEAEPRDRGTA
jgi:ribosome-associated protein